MSIDRCGHDGNKPQLSSRCRHLCRGASAQSGNVNSTGEVSLSISMEQKNVLYPIGSFPEIREFAAMLEYMKAGGIWNGVHFHGYTVAGSSTAPMSWRSTAIAMGSCWVSRLRSGSI